MHNSFVRSNEVVLAANFPAEKSLLGLCLNSLDAVNETVASLKPLDFADPNHQRIFQTMVRLYNDDEPVTVEAVSEHHERWEAKFPLSSGYVLELFASAPRSYLPRDFINDVKQASLKRSFANLCLDLAKEVNSTLGSFEAFYEKSLAEFSKLSFTENFRGPVSIKQIIDTGFKQKSFLKTVEYRQEKFRKKESAFEGYPTHWLDVDKLLNGVTPGHLTIIGARPGVGKTTVALQFLERMILQNKQPCLFFSLEMPAFEIVQKMICAHSRVSYDKVSKGDVVTNEYQELVKSSHAFDEKMLHIDDQPSLTIEQVYSRTRRAVKSHNVKIVVIDYIQLLRTARTAENRQLEVSEISKSLKAMAKDLQICVVSLAQLNRQLELRNDKKPYISDLRESGALEQDSDEIILLHRPELYDGQLKPGQIEFHIVKNRFGPLGESTLVFSKQTGRIDNLASKQENQSYTYIYGKDNT